MIHLQRMLVLTSATSCMNSTAEESSLVPTFCRYAATKLDSDWWRIMCKGRKWENGRKEGREEGRERSWKRSEEGKRDRGVRIKGRN